MFVFVERDRTSLTKTNDEIGGLVSNRSDCLTECRAECVCVCVDGRVNEDVPLICERVSVSVCVCVCVSTRGCTASCLEEILAEGRESCRTRRRAARD